MKSFTWFALLLAASLFVTNQSQAQVTTFPLSGLDGTVIATWWSGEDLIIGGSFVWVDGSVRLNRIGRWDGTTFHAYGEGFNGSVNVLTVLENGTLVAAGTFTHSGETVLNRIARWNGQEWLPFGSGFASGEVYALSEFRGELVAAGLLPNGNNIMKWNGETWTTLGLGFNDGAINSLIVFEDQLIAGGEFRVRSGVTFNRIARWNGDTWSPMGPGFFSGRVRSLVIWNDSLIASGSFTSLSTFEEAYRVVRWNGTTWATVGTPPSVDFSGIAVHDNTLYGVNLNGVYRLTNTEWERLWLSPSELKISVSLRSLASDGQRLAIGGLFTDVSNGHRNLIIWDGEGFEDSPTMGSNQGINGAVYAISQTSQSMVIGGILYSAGSIRFPMIVAGTLAGFDTLGSGLNGPVRAITAWNDTVVAGGDFTSNVARFSQNSWSILGSGLGASVYALARHEGTVVAGGSAFLDGSGSVIGNMVRWTGSEWQLMGDGFTGQVRALHSNGSNLIAGGTFTRSGARTINRISRWDGSTWQAMGSGFNGNVLSIAEFDGMIIAAGDFTQSGSSIMNRIARWTGSAWQPLGNGFSASVNALAVHGNDLYAAGAFPGGLAKWNGVDWESVGSGTDGTIHALSIRGNELHIGGVFQSIDGQASSSYAIRLLDPTSVDSSVDERPSRAVLHQNYPNPFNPTTMLRFELPSATQVNLELFDMLGRRVATVISGQLMASGSHDILLNAESLASGIYLARLSTSDHVSVIKLSVLK